MRMMMRVTIPVERGNAALRDGSLPKIVQSALEELEPEAAYFTTMSGGLRGGFMVFDLKDASDLPRIAEPFFQGLNAAIEFSPVMNANDLKAGVSKLKL
jgi:Domain of unknown function (DUF3303)